MPFKIAPPKPVTTSSPASATVDRPEPKSRVARSRARKGGKGILGVKIRAQKQDKEGKPMAETDSSGEGGINLAPNPYTPFDLVEEITYHGKSYHAHGEDTVQLTLRTFPGFLSTALNQIRHNCRDCYPPPSQNLILTVCLTQAIRYFLTDEDMLDLGRIKAGFYRDSPGFASIRAVSIAESYLMNMPIGAAYGNGGSTMAKPSRLGARIPETLNSQIAGRVEALGLTKQDIVVLCLCLVISSQSPDVCHADLIKDCRETFNTFAGLAKLRSEFNKLIIDKLVGERDGGVEVEEAT